MMIPDGPNGHPTLSASQLRVYGTGGFELEYQEDPKGCPRKYHSKYVLKEKFPEEFSYPLVYGGLFHKVMHLMEEPGLPPEEALEEAFEPWMPVEMWTEAREDLARYMERGSSPSDRFATLAVETELTGLLYEDEDFGPIYYRGFLDWIGLDLDYPTVVHSVDYKTNRSPASVADLRGDVQLRSYHWLILQNAARFVQVGNPRVVTHLDVVKFNDVEVAYSPADIEDWHSWAVAMARKILRDETHEPILNSMCSSCPIRDTCPAYAGMPMEALALTKQLEGLQDPVARLAWRDKANAMRLNLEKSVKSIDTGFQAEAKEKGRLEVAGEVWSVEPNFVNRVDLRRMYELLGERFWRVASTSKTALERELKSDEPSFQSQIMGLFRPEPDGTKIVRKKARTK